MDKYKIGYFTAIFLNRITEARFFETNRKEIQVQLKYSLSIGIAILWIYSIVDYILLDSQKAGYFLLLKIIPTVSSGIFLYISPRLSGYSKYYSYSLLNSSVFILTATVIFSTTPGSALEMAMTQIIFIMGISLMIPNILPNTMLISVLSSLVFSYIDLSNEGASYTSVVIILSSFISYNLFIYFYSRKVNIESRLKFRELIKEQKYIVVLNKEIHKRTELEKKLTRLACVDYLTEVSNRRYFMDIAEHELEKIKRSKEPLSIMLVDIDNFKVINDTYGHSVGDLAIKTFVEIAKKALRKSDFIGRIGGEEFAVLCCNSNKKVTTEIANRLCKSIETETKNLKYHFTASIGVSEIRPEHQDIDKALHLADLALYEAKRSGKNQVVCS